MRVSGINQADIRERERVAEDIREMKQKRDWDVEVKHICIILNHENKLF